MRFLVVWDDPAQADLLRLYLAVDDDEAVVVDNAADAAELLLGREEFDAALITINHPTYEAAFALFRQFHEHRPDLPVLGACETDDVYRVAKFLTQGMRAYLIRDDSGDFLFLVRSMLEGVVQAVRAERERIVAQKLRQEVESVRRLQQSLVPDKLTAPDGYQMVGRYESSQIRVLGGRPVTMAGGDYYDAFMLPDGRVALIVGDASGHGMKACMSIMTMQTLIRAIRSGDSSDTAAFVADVNRQLCDHAIVNGDGGFITLLYGVLDPVAHTLQWTSAGHPIPVLQDLSGGACQEVGGLDDGGLPLGIIPEAEYESHKTTVPANSRMLIYTDGLAEAFAGDPEEIGSHEEFGTAGVLRTLSETHSIPLGRVVDRLFTASEEFTAGHGRHDDTSVLLLERE